jgi:alkanesulfonate monooxygenase SsuD/methylene tetrahydromethanopterin reductase-like flavin-dependent oxidoreductase (luciferase family)
MKVDTGINLDLHAIPDAVKTIEAQGYDGVRTAEMNHDPFFPLLLAAEHSEKLEISPSVSACLGVGLRHRCAS